jgi:hypothetical protein
MFWFGLLTGIALGCFLTLLGLVLVNAAGPD